MSAEKKCSECGMAIAPGSNDGLCAPCLFDLALDTAETPVPTTPPSDLSPLLAKAAPAVGVKLHYFGDYELIEEIARGGMGVVFKARQMSLNRLVALKLISVGMLANEELVKRFKAEAEATASMSHPNIVPIFEIGEHQGQHYFSMGLIEGPNLREALAQSLSHQSQERSKELRAEHWPLKSSAKLISTIARAVHYTHQRGVLHRDIKPSNILLDGNREPHLTDFGLAKLVEKESTLTHTNAVMGTPAYMSPEQARGETKNVTTATDIYGLGAVLYETLTGSPPFGGGTSMETIRQVLEQEARRPSIFNPEVDRDLETICLKCLEKDPQRRYGSAGLLAGDLDRWQRREPITARPISGYERVKKWVRRRPAIAALGAVSVISVLALAMGSTVAAFRIASGKKILRRNLYSSDMNVAFQSWQTGDADRARALLTNQIPLAGEEDLRGWEWRYLFSRCRPLELATLEIGGNLTGLASTPDGKIFATHGFGIPLQLWDATSLRPLATLPNDLKDPYGYSVSFSPDGRQLVSTHYGERTVQLWDVREGRLLGMFTNHHLPVASAVFTPDGRAVISTGGPAYTTNRMGELKLWDAATFKELENFEPVEFSAICCDVSSDGRLVAVSGFAPFVQIWDLRTRRPVARLAGHETKLMGAVFALRFSPDGQSLVTGDMAGTIRLWNLWTNKTEWGIGEPILLGAHGHPVFSVVFSPDSQRLVSASFDHTAKVWDLPSQRETATLRGHAGRLWRAAFIRDGKTLATSANDGRLKLWNAYLSSDDNVFASVKGQPSFSANGRFMASAADHIITTWDLSKGNAIRQLKGRSFAFSPVGNTLALVSPEKRLQIWSLDSFTQVAGPRDTSTEAMGWKSPAFSAGGKRFAFVSSQGNIHIWTVAGWNELPKIEAKADWVLIPRDDETVMSGGAKTEITLWRAGSGERIGSFGPETSGAKWASISPEGRLLATGRGDTVRLWEVATRRATAQFKGGSDTITSVAFSEDGKTLAVGTFDGVIQLWNVASGQQTAALQGHVSFVDSLAFSPAGNALASSGMDNTIRLWKAATWEEIARSAPVSAQENQ